MANLRIPGPTPLHPKVLSSLSKQLISHRGKGYEKVHQEVIANLQYFFQTNNPIYLLTASGTAGLETAVVNFFSPGDPVVFFTCGEFGNRWAEIGRRYGLNVLNDLSAIAPIVKSHPDKPLLLVDSVSALGAVDLPMDKLRIDVLVTASQKAWMSSPGIAMIAVSPYAWEKHQFSTFPRYYFDLTLYEKFSQKNQTPATPAVSVLFSLQTALKLMKKQGREKIFKKHLELKDYFREQIRKIGLKLVVDDKEASPTVTSIWPPEGVDEASWRKLLREKYNTVIAGGMGGLKGKIVRVAHMGYVSKKDLDQVLISFKKSLEEIV
ncbi:MAG: Phosphoserine aminotransferase apoenzyme / L-aspartate aminotransferase apoenzyme [Candidatus Roizmanbacteria bacterium GW2011_GWA2_34_18]|uniref:Phosphoserine aminotransferase apoenzyme / L-aspartate aminotransferase apoenzyme n=1 Tax=Candidatus Roizmanbacteria bacterium GW2011_GWA2_34_18 TaxID=1618477 RepID=A0A0G0DA66_9BACT|nr:MAG: Phosphoserine aminotransferase apoenzyme / L-aspartate aminotransferase apoenzyme [Candidatus Roizmanbacteria bacterium GW2011_GWA2_34_18]